MCGVSASSGVEWCDPATRTDPQVSDQTVPSGPGRCGTVTTVASTSPSVTGLYGTVFVVPADTDADSGLGRLPDGR